MGSRALAVAGGIIAAAIACASSLTPLLPRGSDISANQPAAPAPVSTRPAKPRSSDASPVVRAGARVRVAIRTAAASAAFDATGPWSIVTGSGSPIRARAGDLWIVSPDRRGRGTDLSISGPSGRAISASRIALEPVATSDFLRLDGHRYRGRLSLVAGDSGVMVINELDVEDYLRGVVPLEIGNRPAAEQAAAEAQAIAARSVTYIRLRAPRREYDILAGSLEQVYGGLDAERPASDRAVAATSGQGLFYNGRLVDAPYHSTCGGSTAAAGEVWQTRGDFPYLRAVSDRIPGTSDRYWCDGSASFRWTRTLHGDDVTASVRRYLRSWVPSAPANPGVVRDLIAGPRTPSGRLASITLITDRGRYALRGNAMRFVLRGADGAILNNTYFSFTTGRNSNGELESVAMRGNGNGHGIGMCQWGAIGRARAGQTARQILSAYYPGTTVASINGLAP